MRLFIIDLFYCAQRRQRPLLHQQLVSTYLQHCQQIPQAMQQQQQQQQTQQQTQLQVQLHLCQVHRKKFQQPNLKNTSISQLVELLPQLTKISGNWTQVVSRRWLLQLVQPWFSLYCVL